MVNYISITAVLVVVLLFRFLVQPAERCSDCGKKREDEHPICECGWVFEFPDDDKPLEYGDPDENDEEHQTRGF